jgi:hypothetical protein
MKKLIFAALLTLLVGCTDETRSNSVLQGAGFTNIQFTGYKYFSCDKEEDVHTGFVATGPTGQRTEGTVCCGSYGFQSWGKGCTIRF